MRLRAYPIPLNLGLCFERPLKVLGVNTRFGSLRLDPLRPCRSVTFDELSFGRASGKDLETRRKTSFQQILRAEFERQACSGAMRFHF
jgi:hypothetical protein